MSNRFDALREKIGNHADHFKTWATKIVHLREEDYAPLHEALRIASLIESGKWAIVPAEPTTDMLMDCGPMEGYELGPDADKDHIDWWKSMLAAAPKPTEIDHDK